MKVAIQGGKASFHHAAALQYFAGQTLELAECNFFNQVCDALGDSRADYGIMAIENTLAGSILPNYMLLLDSSLSIVGEIYLRIDQNLMALPGQRLEDIRVARSHPMALLQCSGFLHSHPHIAPEEAFDTADSARDIRKGQLTGVAAIAGRLAAELYDLEILEPEIENEKTNYTRFLVLSRGRGVRTTEASKATVIFSIKHECGALVDILAVFKKLNCNLTLIQSVPMASRPYEYSFCVDFEFDDHSILDQALMQLQNMTFEMTLIGAYERGQKPLSHNRN